MDRAYSDIAYNIHIDLDSTQSMSNNSWIVQNP
jgi:hypothetical protein